MPALASRGRCIAVDLIGMGNSDKLDNPGPDSYRYVEHRDFLFKAWEALGVSQKVTLVIHDWGSALGFDWASQHPYRLRGICYMEGIPCPIRWEDWPEVVTPIFRGFRSEAGESMVLEKNVFVEKVLPGSVLRGLTDEEMAAYRRPFENPGEDRRPTLTWPRQIPLEWLKTSEVPKLFINAEPGAILVGRQREFARSLPNQVEVTVRGSHFIQEDSPEEIASAIADWLDTL
jgi:haloalkane dehalogenase